MKLKLGVLAALAAWGVRGEDDGSRLNGLDSGSEEIDGSVSLDSNRALIESKSSLRHELRGNMESSGIWDTFFGGKGIYKKDCPKVASTSKRLLDFLPKRDGFNFYNGDWGQVCVTVVGLDKLRYTSKGGICRESAGLCAGMSLWAGERFLAKEQPITYELEKSASKGKVIDSQMRTMTYYMARKWLNWIASPDKGHWHDPNNSVGYMMKEEWPCIQAALDRGDPVVVGLVYDKTATLLDLKEIGAISKLSSQHSVLIVGYDRRGDSVTASAYDPNYPGDLIEMTINLGSAKVSEVFQSDQRPVNRKTRAWMYMRTATGRADRISCPTGKTFSTTGDYHNCLCPNNAKKLYLDFLKATAVCQQTCPSSTFWTTGEYHSCICPDGRKKHYLSTPGSSQAVCERTCPTGQQFSTTNNYRGCKCPADYTKKYLGIFNEKATCVYKYCPSGKFSTRTYRGCSCRPGTSKKYEGWFKSHARCK